MLLPFICKDFSAPPATKIAFQGSIPTLRKPHLTYTQSKNGSKVGRQSSWGSLLFLAFFPPPKKKKTQQQQTHLSSISLTNGEDSCKWDRFDGLWSVLLIPSNFSHEEETSLGLNLVKHRPDAGPSDPGIWLCMPAAYSVSCVTHVGLCLECIMNSGHVHSFYRHHLFNSQESAGHCQLQRSLSAGAKRGTILAYTPQAKSSALLALPHKRKQWAKQNKNIIKTKQQQKKTCPCSKRKAGKDKGIHTQLQYLYVYWSKGKTQAHSPGWILWFGLFSGILSAKLLLRSPGVFKNEQTVLLSLEKHLLWKQQDGGKKKKKKKIKTSHWYSLWKQAFIFHPMDVTDDERCSPTKAMGPWFSWESGPTREGTESGQ